MAKQAALSLDVYALDGSKSGTVSLAEELFAAKQSDQTLMTYLRVYQHNQRRGTASTKTRSEVIGSTRKIYRQKGTGNARHGAKKAPIFVGGGITFGPKPKEYQLKMNKKQKQVALRTMLTQKYTENQLYCLNEAAYEIEPKTKNIAQFLRVMQLEGKKVLLVLNTPKADLVKRAARNIESISVTNAPSINPYQLISHDVVIFVQDTVDLLNEHFMSKQ